MEESREEAAVSEPRPYSSLTAAERRRFRNSPIVFRIIERKTWGGTIIVDMPAAQGATPVRRRTQPWDEERWKHVNSF